MRDDLVRALALVRRATQGHVEDFEQAITLASMCLTSRLSRRQRMQTLYTLGLCHAGKGELEQASLLVDAALDLAHQLAEPEACARLAYFAGSMERARSHYESGADYQSLCIALLQELSTDEEPADTALALDGLILQMTCLFGLGRFDLASDRIASARRILTFSSVDIQRAASVEWVAALLYRWTGQSALALQHALAAAQSIEEHASSPGEFMSLGRIQTVVADIALDLAEPSSPWPASRGLEPFLAIARPSVKKAIVLARGAADDPGRGIATLAQVRYQRLSGHGTDRIGAIEAVIRSALKLGDPDLLIQAQTALGHEYAAQGETKTALSRYRTAVDLAHRHHVPVLGVWARRAILYESEMRSDL